MKTLRQACALTALLVFLVPSALVVHGQQVSGTVTESETGSGLPGANIVVKGTTIGTTTDIQGNYSLEVPSLQDTLLFTYVGYQREEVAIAGRTSVDVVMEPEAIEGEEVVVVGGGSTGTGIARDLAMRGLDVTLVEQYELGEQTPPMHELSVLASAVDRNLDYFLETTGQIGVLLALREEWKHFAQLPDEVRAFAADPKNIGFIHIAVMLSKMPADQLREVGASILDITM